MTFAVALLLLQTAVTLGAAAPVTPEPQRFSVLANACAAASDDKGKDIVVCGDPNALKPRLPLPQYRGPPNHPAPSNPDLSAAVALNGPSARGECGAYGEGCPVGGGGYLLPAAIDGALDLAHNAFRKRHYRNKGVSIPLDDPPPPDPKEQLLP